MASDATVGSGSAAVVETDVLVVGSGPAGAAAALFLATYGTRTLVVTRYSALADTPRSHITNQRTMETLRDMGLEERLMREATRWEFMSNTTFCTSLAGEELGRIPSWGTDTARHADYELQSPCSMVDAPQTIAQPTTWPGARLPHTWVTRNGHRLSTLDLAGHGRFSLWTGLSGGAWLEAGRVLSEVAGLPIDLVQVGPGAAIEDPYGTWADLAEICDGGVLLVRPDLHVAARQLDAPAGAQQASAWLQAALDNVLARQVN